MQMLAEGRENVAVAGLGTRIQLVAGPAEQLPFVDQTFDALTFTYLLRYVDDPQATLRELARVVKPGATAASLEFFLPPNRFWRVMWWLYTDSSSRSVVCSPAAGRGSGSVDSSSTFLGG